MHVHVSKQIVLLGIALLLVQPVFAFDSGSDGSDGAFAPDPNDPNAWVIDLGLAATATWDTPSANPGMGVYDPEKWAVVFKYTTIDVPEGVTVTFKNHPSHAPVIWLAQGDVVIAGTVDLQGEDGLSFSYGASFAEPGPGGFQGGRRGYDTDALCASPGFGPGGANIGILCPYGAGGGYATNGNNGSSCSEGGSAYGNGYILPLIGGSGGSAGTSTTNSGGAGAGGGAIMIASDAQIAITGTLNASGGVGARYYGGGGSGGAIRLIAETITGYGSLYAIRGYGDSYGNGSYGWIRIDAEEIDSDLDSNPPYNTDNITYPVFPPSPVPTLRVARIHDQDAPADPAGGILTTDVEINTSAQVIIDIEAANIPVGTTVTVMVIPARGERIEIEADAPLAGTFETSTTTATVAFPTGRTEIQLKANWTP